MKQLNTFTDKIIGDLDFSYIKNTQWTFPTLNMRLVNKVGQGLILTNVSGNEESFQISEGFVALGACQYNGIVYIASYSETENKGEVGCYPSPRAWTEDNTEFDRSYKPLIWKINFEDTEKVIFKTSLFNFDNQHPIDIIAKPSYDDTIDLYLVDNKNPNRVINSCFNQAGNYIDRLLWKGAFDGRINQIPSSKKPPRLEMTDVLEGGRLKPGNYYIFIRYCTKDFARTSFMTECGPIPIAETSDQANRTHGLQEKSWIRNSNNFTNKKISLNVEYYDTAYEFFEVAVIRYSSLIENGSAQPDVYLINQLFPIHSPLGFIYKIFVTGYEDQVNLSLFDVFVPQNEFSICSSQGQLLSRWWGADWKVSVSKYDDEPLLVFASKITDDYITFSKHKTGPDNIPIEDFDNGSAFSSAYQIPWNVNHKLGYFRSQIYPFGIVAVYSNGSVSKAFPIGDIEKKGLIKFPDWDDVRQNEALAINFSIGSALDDKSAFYYWSNNKELFQDIIGFYFVRGERIDNFLYQGLLLRGFWGVYYAGSNIIQGDDEEKFIRRNYAFGDQASSDPTGAEPNNASILPLYKGNFPLLMQERYTENRFYEYSFEQPRGWYYPDGEKWILLRCGVQSDHPIYIEEMETLPALGVNTSLPDWEKRLDRTWGTKDYCNKWGLFSPDAMHELSPDIPEWGYADEIFRIESVNLAERLYHQAGACKIDGDWLIHDILYPRVYALDLGVFNYDFTNNHLPSIHLAQQGIREPSSVGMVFVPTGIKKTHFNFGSAFKGAGSGEVAIANESKLKNRSLFMPNYIGVFEPNGFDGGGIRKHDWNDKLSIYNLYLSKNDDNFKQTITESFDPSIKKYSKISGFIELVDGLDGNFELWGGDCFLQQVWFRQIRHLGLDEVNVWLDGTCGVEGFGYDAKDPRCALYQHGLLIGGFFECKYNHGLRNDVIAQDDLGSYLEYTFYPASVSEGTGSKKFAVEEDGKYRHEAFQINNGYNKVISDKVFLGYDPILHERAIERPNRIYHSDEYVIGSYVDAYRSVRINNYRDFNISGGRITKIIAEQSHLAAVQERAIIQCYFEQEKSVASTSDITNIETNVLSTYFRIIAKYGSKHLRSITQGQLGYYGIDYDQRKIWRILLKTSATATQYLDTESLAEENLIQIWINDVFNEWSTVSTKIDSLPNDAFNGVGIVSGVDPDYSEVLFSFLIYRKAASPDNSSNDQFIAEYRTLVFSELKNGFIGEYEFVSPLYFNINKDLYSVKPYINPETFKLSGTSSIYIHNRSPLTSFYEEVKIPVVSFLVNGIETVDDEGKTFNASKMMKAFNSQSIEVNDVTIEKITWSTLYQRGVYIHTTDSQKFWRAAKYQEHEWNLPIVIQSSLEQNDFKPGSTATGKWIKVTLEFGSEDVVNLRSTITRFIESNI